MTDHTQARSVWDMSAKEWNEMTAKLDVSRVTAEDFKRHNANAEDIDARMRAFDNPTSEETLRIIVD
ncbi:MAG: hypothetical protein ACPGU7_12980 [Gammaproteobacteria bacterium]